MKNIKIAVIAAMMSMMVAFGARAEVATPSNATSVETEVVGTEENVENDDQIIADDIVVGDSDDEYVVEDEVESKVETDEVVDSGSKDSESKHHFFDFPETPEEPEPEIPDEPEDIPVATPSEPQRIPTQVVVTFTVPTIPDEPEDTPVATPSEAEKPEEPEKPEETPDEPKQPETPDQPTVTPEEPEQPKDEPVATPSNAEKPEHPETPDHPQQPEEHPEQPEHRVPQIPDVPVVYIVEEPVPESVEPHPAIAFPVGDQHQPVIEETESHLPEYPLTIPKTGDETPLYPVVMFVVALIGMIFSAIGMMRESEVDGTVAYTAARKAAATVRVNANTKNAIRVYGDNNLYSKRADNNRRMPIERGIPPFEIRADNIHPPLE